MYNLLLLNGYTFNVVDVMQRSFLVPVAEVLNPLVGFRTTYQELLEYTYYFPKELHMTITDIDNMTYEWAKIIFDKLNEDKKEEAKRQKEENERQERENQQQQQMMNNQYNFSNYQQQMSSYPNFSMPDY